MDPPVTYQQLLAEQYADNATQLLAFQQSNYYDDDSEYAVDPYAGNVSLKSLLEIEIKKKTLLNQIHTMIKVN